MIDRIVKRLVRGTSKEELSFGVPNYFVVNDLVGRCGQPTLTGWHWLRDEGYKVAVKLNMESEGSDLQAEALGFTVYRFPITIWQQLLFGPGEQRMHDIVQVIRSGVKVVCHCTHGQDRTGLAIMFTRIADGWTWDDAFKEAMQRGFHQSMQGLYGYALRHKPTT